MTTSLRVSELPVIAAICVGNIREISCLRTAFVKFALSMFVLDT